MFYNTGSRNLTVNNSCPSQLNCRNVRFTLELNTSHGITYKNSVNWMKLNFDQVSDSNVSAVKLTQQYPYKCHILSTLQIAANIIQCLLRTMHIHVQLQCSTCTFV